MSAIAKSYWMSIQRGTRTFSAVPEALRGEVRALAQADVAAGLIDAAAYQEITGEEYAETGYTAPQKG